MNRTEKLLIIDDDPDFVDGIKSILKSDGFDPDVVHTSKEGFEALQSKHYDLVLLDIMMGRGAEGLMVARQMGRDPVLREIPLLIITGIREQIAFLFPGHALHPHYVNVDELMEKPVEPDVLLERVHSLLKAAETKKEKAK